MLPITVVTTDIINSRRSAKELEDLAPRLHRISHPLLVTPFILSRGDEIQAVLSGWLGAPEVIRLLRWHCRPLALRVGIGLGLYPAALGEDPWAMNGEPFYLARQALSGLAGAKQQATQISTGRPPLDQLANAVLLMIDTIQRSWTEPQWEAVMTYEALKTYAAAAKQLGVAPQNVQKRCKAAAWPQVRQAEEALQHLQSLLTAHNPL